MFSHFWGFRWKFPGKHLKFQGVTETIVSWLFPGGMEISRGPWNIPGGTQTILTWFFPGGMEISRDPWKNPGDLLISLWTRCAWYCAHMCGKTETLGINTLCVVKTTHVL